MEKVRASLVRIAKTALGDSLPADMTGRIARELIRGYDLNVRTGFPDSIAISSQVAASAVVDDVVAGGRFLPLVERLASLDREGFMGRQYRVPALRELMKAIQAEGYIWDEPSRRFMENPEIRRTSNWGCLLEREEYRFTLLKLDIVKNSALVKRHGEEAARAAYGLLRERFTRMVEQRLGRIWRWEGDGGFAAFHYGHSSTSAILAGMAFINDLYVFNRASNALGEPIAVRLAAHSGALVYHSSFADLAKQETIKEIAELESKKTLPNCFCVGSALTRSMDKVLQDRFRPVRMDGTPVFHYSVELEAQ